MKRASMALGLIVFAAAHQDFWLWTDKTLVLGFIPVGLAYHLGYTLLAALTMAALVKWAWPADLDRAS